MFDNHKFGGYSSNTFNPARKNLQSGNIAGLNKGPSSVAGINKQPNNLVGMSKKPEQQNPFNNVVKDNCGPAKRVMNSKGQNLIHNEFRGIKN